MTVVLVRVKPTAEIFHPGKLLVRFGVQVRNVRAQFKRVILGAVAQIQIAQIHAYVRMLNDIHEVATGIGGGGTIDGGTAVYVE